MSVTVYTLPACPQCDFTKRKLDRDGVPYETIDLSQNPEAMSFVQSLGYSAAPVVVAGDRHWAGLRPDLLASLVPVVA